MPTMTITMTMAMVMVVVIDMMMRMVSEHSDEGIEPGLDLLPTRANDIIQEVDIYCCRVTGKIVKHTSLQHKYVFQEEKASINQSIKSIKSSLEILY